ncbi:MAG: hypothetical protein ACREMJ_02025 [Gemmatimonadales bacterium]
MPDERLRGRAAAIEQLADALSAARCSVRVAGLSTDDFIVRELLLAVLDELDRASAAVRRLC